MPNEWPQPASFTSVEGEYVSVRTGLLRRVVLQVGDTVVELGPEVAHKIGLKIVDLASPGLRR